MVMEAGETDLNGVLQQHQKAQSLTPNFVRLTWQQMIEAVQVKKDIRFDVSRPYQSASFPPSALLSMEDFAQAFTSPSLP